MAKTSTTLMSNSGENGQPCLMHDPRGRMAFSFHIKYVFVGL